jgi:hypothetical protein
MITMRIWTTAVACLLAMANPANADNCKKWYYWGSVQLYHYSPTRLETKSIIPGFVAADSEGQALIFAQNKVRADYAGKASIVTPLVSVKCWDGKRDPVPAPPKKSIITPNDAGRGSNHEIRGAGEGAPNRLTIPSGVRIIGLWVYAGRRVDGFVFEGSDGKNYGFKGYGEPEPKYIKLDDDEFIAGFRAVHGDQWDRVWIITNKREYGGENGYGGGGGHTPFTIRVPSGQKFIGLHGFTGKVIDRAGIVSE